MPRNKKPSLAAPSLSRLKYIGGPEVYFPGVPQADVDVVESPRLPGEISQEQALELVASGLYEDVEGRLNADEAKKLIAAPDEAAADAEPAAAEPAANQEA